MVVFPVIQRIYERLKEARRQMLVGFEMLGGADDFEDAVAANAEVLAFCDRYPDETRIIDEVLA